MDREDTAFVYTLSSRNKMVQQCLRSIATLKHYVDEKQIKIFYTPPYSEEDEKTF
jgi:isochorismate hydrolase